MRGYLRSSEAERRRRKFLIRRNYCLKLNRTLEITRFCESGAFGSVYFGTYKTQKAAIKIEKNPEKRLNFIAREYRHYKSLKRTGIWRAINYQDPEVNKQIAELKRQGSPSVHLIGMRTGVPECYYFSGSEVSHQVLVMSLHGPSLRNLIMQNSPLSAYSVCLVAIQLLDHLRYLHAEGILSCDVKPANIVVGVANSKSLLSRCCIYLIDLGLARRYLDANGRHVPLKKNRSASGTPTYESINTMNLWSPSRRDDLESLFYTLIWLARGKLPWSHLACVPKDRCSSKERRKAAAIRDEKILALKLRWSQRALAAGLPDQVAKFGEYVRNLKYDETPDYAYMRGLFVEAIERKRSCVDFTKLDWHKWDESNFNSKGGTNLTKHHTTDEDECPTCRRKRRKRRGEIVTHSADFAYSASADSTSSKKQTDESSQEQKSETESSSSERSENSEKDEQSSDASESTSSSSSSSSERRTPVPVKSRRAHVQQQQQPQKRNYRSQPHPQQQLRRSPSPWETFQPFPQYLQTGMRQY